MELLTWEQLKENLWDDMDLEDENFITDEGLVRYVNRALDDAETCIHTLHHEDKYFLTNAVYAWESGLTQYSLPADIYANKIRLIFYSNGSLKYPVTRIKQLENIPYIQTADRYQYIIYNSMPTSSPQEAPAYSNGGVYIQFYPPIAETSENATIWYIRNMKKMTTDEDDTSNICEIPETVNFVYQHVRLSVAKKMRVQSLIDQERIDLKIQYDLMCDALKEMVPDEDNRIPPDLSAYWDQSLIWQGGY
jgi:hypothetical protein